MSLSWLTAVLATATCLDSPRPPCPASHTCTRSSPSPGPLPCLLRCSARMPLLIGANDPPPPPLPISLVLHTDVFALIVRVTVHTDVRTLPADSVDAILVEPFFFTATDPWHRSPHPPYPLTPSPWHRSIVVPRPMLPPLPRHLIFPSLQCANSPLTAASMRGIFVASLPPASPRTGAFSHAAPACRPCSSHAPPCAACIHLPGPSVALTSRPLRMPAPRRSEIST
jgi:hypothetical protein